MNRCAGVNVPLETVLRRVIRSGFPELSRRRIAIRFADCDSLMRYDVDGDGFAIFVDDWFSGAPRHVLEGGIAHELAHIVRDSGLKPFARELAFQKYQHSAAYRIRDERQTDLTAIARGYGRHLVEFMRYAQALGHRFAREHGLSLAEVKRICRRGYSSTNNS